jgi:hypothetical protein
VLGVAPHATAAEVRARFTELTADLEARLQQARTPNLKATYQKNLEEAKRAADLLAPGLATVDVHDLPSVQPTVIPDEMDISIPAPVRAALVHLDESAPERQSGVPAKATTYLSFTAMTLIALCAFFALSKGKIIKDLAKKNASPEYKAALAAQALYAPMDTLEKAGVLKNGALKICNKSSRPLEVLWLGATYGAPRQGGRPGGEVVQQPVLRRLQDDDPGGRTGAGERQGARRRTARGTGRGSSRASSCSTRRIRTASCTPPGRSRTARPAWRSVGDSSLTRWLHSGQEGRARCPRRPVPSWWPASPA